MEGTVGGWNGSSFVGSRFMWTSCVLNKARASRGGKGPYIKTNPKPESLSHPWPLSPPCSLPSLLFSW